MPTVRRWLRQVGFRYVERSKGLHIELVYILYFIEDHRISITYIVNVPSGHGRPDVVRYRQEKFLPAMAKYFPNTIRFDKEDVDRQLPQIIDPPKKPLVWIAHDESTFIANNDKVKSWVLDNEFKLAKKGAGKGVHCSEFICGTVSHM